MKATVHSINVSDGGVPKIAVPSARVSTKGVQGDRQADLRFHGGPRQTVCLYSLEVIEGFQAEGHSIAPGSAGENLTIKGLDWSSIENGMLLAIGVDLVLEITDPAVPCFKNKQWFSDGRFSRMSNDKHPGSSRWYAMVRNAGSISTGDYVEII